MGVVEEVEARVRSAVFFWAHVDLSAGHGPVGDVDRGGSSAQHRVFEDGPCEYQVLRAVRQVRDDAEGRVAFNAELLVPFDLIRDAISQPARLLHYHKPVTAEVINSRDARRSPTTGMFIGERESVGEEGFEPPTFGK